MANSSRLYHQTIIGPRSESVPVAVHVAQDMIGIKESYLVGFGGNFDPNSIFTIL